MWDNQVAPQVLCYTVLIFISESLFLCWEITEIMIFMGVVLSKKQ